MSTHSEEGTHLFGLEEINMASVPINAALSLKSLEESLAYVTDSREEQTVIRVPTDVGTQFFKETWVIAILGTFFQHPNVSIVDWHAPLRRPRPTSGEPQESKARTPSESLIEFAMQLYSSSTARGTEDALMSAEFAEALLLQGGLLEKKSVGHSLSICAVDPEIPIPTALPLGQLPSTFTQEFQAKKRKYLEVGKSAGFSQRHPKTDELLSQFVYELYHNTLHHGRFGRSNTTIPGIRYVHLKRHIGHRKDKLLSDAQDFPELSGYLENTAPKKGTFTFLEIAISDRGIGLVDRFLLTRPDLSPGYVTQTQKTRLGVINRIIKERLSSKTNQPGAGDGLSNAMSAVARLKGFISVRSGTEWAHKDYSKCADGDYALETVSIPHPLARVAGTHYNVLIPFSE